ncbi:MAG: HYR domain-containing protein [Saprospiraceae bacterium]|nr:HYR domain-containing protein [Saprospiraceae bacterium]
MNTHLSKNRLFIFILFLSFNLSAQTTLPCAKYEVLNTNNICGCNTYLFRPYGLFMEASNACGLEYYKPDTVFFEIRNDSTAAIRGVFRTFDDWRPVRVDISLAKTSSSTPRFDLCMTGSQAVVANQWRYFGAMSGTIQFDGAPPLSISSRGGNFQVGLGANGQNADQFGGSGFFTLSNGQRGGFGFVLANPTNGSCVLSDSCQADARPPIFSNCPPNISVTTTGARAIANWTPPTATDNCGTPSVNSNFSSGESFPVGSTTVIYTAKDLKNNVAECRFNVVVSVVNPCDNDLTPPVFANCPTNISVTTTNTSAVVAWTPPTATDNCSIPFITTNFSPGASFPIGTTTVVYTAKDAKNNIAECRFNVVVAAINPCDNDVVPPNISNCPANITVSTTSTHAVATWTPPTATDNCTTPSVTSNFQSGASFPIGSTTVSYIVTDARGNVSECRFTITVQFLDPCSTDATPPAFTNCPANISLTTTGSSAVATWTAPTATDNCTTPSVSSNFQSGASFFVGTTTVIYTARDAKNNTSECRFTVTVTRTIATAGTCTSYRVDNTNDICGCPTRQWMPYGLFIDAGNGCGDYYKADSVTFQINGDSSARLVGIFRTATWRPVWLDIQWAKTNQIQRRFSTCANDTAAANTWRFFGTAQGNIQFDDEHPLSITNRSLLQVGVSANGQNRDLLGASGLIELGDGRIGSVNFVLSNPVSGTCDLACVNDTIAPRILNCPKNKAQITTQVPVSVTWAAPSVRDDCSSPTLVTTHLPNANFGAGETVVTYTARDVNGNIGTCSFKVTITKAAAGSICSTYEVENTNDICGCSANQWKPYALRIGNNNCGEYFKSDSVVLHINGDSTAQLQGRFRSDTWQPIWVDVRFDKASNRIPRFELCNNNPHPDAQRWRYFGSISGTLKLNDGSTKQIQTGSSLQIGKGANGQNMNVEGGYVTFVLENGESASFNMVLSNFQQFTCPNYNPCAFDDVKPTFSNCPRDTTIVTAQNSAIVRWTTPTAVDNCNTPSVSSTIQSGTNFALGTTEVTYTARDSSGNTAQCRFTVTVVQNLCLADQTAPVFRNCPRDTSIITTQTSAIVRWNVPTVTDNCSTPSVSSNFQSGASFALGSTVVIYTARDSGGNTSQCRFTVTVVQNPCIDDRTPPTFRNCPTDTIFAITGTSSAVVYWTPPTATDNCSTPSVSSNFQSGMTFNLGATIISYRAIDALGNISTCNFIVFVRLVNAVEDPLATLSLLKVSPNPAVNSITLDWQSRLAEDVQLEISNTLGQVLMQEKIKMRIGDNRLQLDISHLAKGIYHVTLRHPQMGVSKAVRFMKI